MDTEFESFDGGLLDFLQDLEKNNNREWFNAHKERYEDSLREPALAFIRAMGPLVWSVSPHFLANDRRSGGSLMRIYRDTRFAKDKTPYKTNVGIQFRHEAGKDAHAPGFYFHVERSSAFVGAGVWRPPSPVIKKIRAHIDAEPERWRAILAGAPFEASFRLGGGTLKRHPRGYSADHPLIEDIKRTSFIALSDLSVEEITQDGLPERVQERFAAMGDFVRFLCDAIEVPF